MHVFVETNWLIEVARPIPAPEAQRLLERSRAGDLQLHVPWVSVHEAKRTLDRIIREDLGFPETMMGFVVAEFIAGRLTPQDKQVADALAARGAQNRKYAIANIGPTIDALLGGVEIIAPSEPAIAKTLALYSVKSLKPWDELVLGAVLTKASDLHAAGERDLYFCNLNKRDFAPETRPELEREYNMVGIRYLDTFVVP